MTTPSLDYTITHRFPGLDLSDREFETLIKLASWQRIPEFPRRGRMAWHKLAEPAALVANPDYKLRAAKLKGVGAWNPPDTSRHRDPLLDSFTETPIPPTTKPLESFATRIARGYPFNEVRGRGIAENARGQSPKYFQSLSFYPMWWYSLAMK
ncbi:MAG: hypothetical protein RIG63_13950, partial [Coleofasciculus chthonoplastes F3-SA18-01]